MPGDVILRGPLFDGRAETIIRAYCRVAERKIANRGQVIVRQGLDRSLKRPTGRYRSNIQVTNASPTRVTDGNIIYGNWLEGVGKRNKETRFKGYWTFRKSASVLRGEAKRIAKLELIPYIGRL